MGEVTKLTWPQDSGNRHEKSKMDDLQVLMRLWICESLTIFGWQLLWKSVTMIRNNFFLGSQVKWPGLVTWPDVTWGGNFYALFGIDIEVGVTKNDAAERRSFLPSVKSWGEGGGGVTPRTPARRGLNQNLKWQFPSTAPGLWNSLLICVPAILLCDITVMFSNNSQYLGKFDFLPLVT